MKIKKGQYHNYALISSFDILLREFSDTRRLKVFRRKFKYTENELHFSGYTFSEIIIVRTDSTMSPLIQELVSEN